MDNRTSDRMPNAYRFDAWTLTLSTRQLALDGQEKALEPLIFDLLVYFIEHADRIVSRQELVEAVWKQGFVDDNAINRAISELRKSLQTPEQQSPLIKTHYKQGYQLVPSVQTLFDDKNALEPKSLSEDSAKPDSDEISYRDDILDSSPATSRGIKNPLQRKVYLLLLGIVLLFVCCTLVWFYVYSRFTTTPMPTYTNPELKTTRVDKIASRTDLLFKKGLTIYPLSSQNQRFLAYSHRSQGENGLDVYFTDLNTHKNYLVVKARHEAYPIALDNKGNLVYQTLEHFNGGFQCKIWFAPFSEELRTSSHKHLFDCKGNKVLSGQLIKDANVLIYSKNNYRGSISRSSIYHYKLSNGEEYQMTSPSISSSGDEYIAVSPDESRVVFYRDGVVGGALYITNLEGSEQRVLLELDYVVSSIRWSDDNAKITWLNYQKWEVNTLDIESNELNISKLNYDYAFNPFIGISILSQKRLVFASDYIDYDIFSIDLAAIDGGLRTVIDSFNKELLYLPLKGNYNAVFVKSSSTYQLWSKRGEFREKVMDFEKTTVPSLSRSPDDKRFSIGFPKKFFIFDSNNMNLIKEITFDVATTSVSWFDSDTLLVTKEYQDQLKTMFLDIEDGTFLPFSDISAEKVMKVGNNRVVIQDYNNTLHLVDASGNEISSVTIGGHIQNRWTANESSIFYIKNNREVWQQPFDSNKPAMLLHKLENKGIRYINMHPDKDALFLTTTTFAGNTLYEVQVE